MLSQAITCSFYLDNDGMVKEPIEQRRGHHRVAKDVTPFGKAAIRGEDHGAALIASVDELEEQIATARDDGQVSDFIDDQQRGPAQEANPLAQLSLPFGLWRERR